MAKPNARARRSKFGVFLIVALLLAVGLGVAGRWLWLDYQSFVDAPLAIGDEEQVFEVKRGDSFRHVLRRLRKSGVESGRDTYWELLAWRMGVLTRLQVGEYSLSHGLTPRTLLHKLEQGKVIQYRFTVIEGWNVRDLRRALLDVPSLTQTLAGVSNEQLMKQLGREGVHPEGRFLPETYQFTRGQSDLDILRRALLAMDAALESAWKARDADLPLQSSEDMLILASIIEKETGQSGERREIAGVFIRRMRIGMLLQTDPTVIYGLGESFNGNLTRAHLQTDTPWNTYTRAGLPPTPIALPGVAALRAAVSPAPGDTLYFVARGDGSHQFSRSLAEHNAAVRRYQLRQR
ncbi:MAG: endolytic transglycosylase MltG [Pseudomarimonas sp.]